MGNWASGRTFADSCFIPQRVHTHTYTQSCAIPSINQKEFLLFWNAGLPCMNFFNWVEDTLISFKDD